jgi:hypothetical protein
MMLKTVYSNDRYGLDRTLDVSSGLGNPGRHSLDKS